MENPKGSPNEPKVRSKVPQAVSTPRDFGQTKVRSKFPKGSGNGKTLKKGISDIENLKSETSMENQESVQMGQVCITETLLIYEEWSPDERNNDWSLDEWNDEGSCVGWH